MWTFRVAEDGMLRLNPGLKQAGMVLKEYLERNIPISPQMTTPSIADEIALYGLAGKHKNLIEYEKLQNFRSVERDFRVIDSDTRFAVVDAAVAERLRYERLDWREIQKVSVQIAAYKLSEMGIPHITDDIYHWNLEYDGFLGYMAGIVKLRKYGGAIII
jgi:hypothetical protein